MTATVVEEAPAVQVHHPDECETILLDTREQCDNLAIYRAVCACANEHESTLLLCWECVQTEGLCLLCYDDDGVKVVMHILIAEPL